MLLLVKILGEIAWRLILRSLLLLLAGNFGDGTWRRLSGSNGMPDCGVEAQGVPLAVPYVGLHPGDELPIGPLDVLDGFNIVPVEVVKGQPRDELLDQLVVHQVAVGEPLLVDHQVDEALVDACLVGLVEHVMKTISHVFDLLGSFGHCNLLMIMFGSAAAFQS